jgi:CubicO group peptidase (beta-lactamase class C family)
MNRSRRYLFALQIVIACAALPAVADTLGNRIDKVIPSSFSGQVVIGTSETLLYSKSFGFADREAGKAVENSTLFDIGSITKTFTATALLTLVEQDSVRLDQTLGEWFDGLTPQTSRINIHQLLTHTSGLPMYSGDDDQSCDSSCFDKWLATIEPEFPPGDKFQYSNPGYSVLARIMEKASGISYESFLQKRLIAPLQLGAIGYVHLPEMSDFAVGYLEDKRIGKPPEMGWADDGPPWHLRANGGLLCNAESLFRWLQATATERTLTEEIQAQQFERHAVRREDVWYGYGWGILQKPWGTVIDHTGGNGFFFADARWIKDRDLLIAITNNSFDRETIQSLLDGLRSALELSESD